MAYLSALLGCKYWFAIQDALTYIQMEKTGGINVIDLANINSCSFILRIWAKKINNSFEVLGRLTIQIFEGVT
jgi:hypothetical protein